MYHVLLHFYLCQSDLISPLFLNNSFNGFIGWQSYSLNTLNISPYCLWYPYFWWEVSVLIFSVLSHFSLATFKTLCFCLSNNLIMFCLSVNIFEVILLGAHWASWTFRLLFFTKFGDFSAIISSDILFTPFAIFFPRIPIVCMFIHLNVTLVTKSLLVFLYSFSILYLFLRLFSIDLSSSSAILSSTLAHLLWTLQF